LREENDMIADEQHGEIQRRDRLAKPEREASYYGLPMLKPPAWRWEIAGYFYLGGISSGAFLLARAARSFGGRAGRSLSRAGTVLAVAAFLPCPLLLIKDLGDPKRFHYMLRMFKLRSPMSVGSWTLTGYGALLGMAALAALRSGQRKPTLAEAPLDVLGVPAALLMSSYGGVLLSNTATPLWSQNRFLSALFSTSALHGAAAALSPYCTDHAPALADPLHRIARLGRLASGASLLAYLGTAGRGARPIVRGRYAPLFWVGGVGVGLLVPAALHWLRERTRRK
jgi:formate-dependent nitrite reductase membrane component NrfD